MAGYGARIWADDDIRRAEPYGADYEFFGVLVYGFGGVVCGWQGHFSWYGAFLLRFFIAIN